jgi:inorganic pyrophosphatase
VDIEVIIEIAKGGRNKYEYDRERGVFVLDRVLYSSVHYPTDYGFIPGTMAEDGDPLDIMVMVDEPTFTGCHVLARPVGILIMHDEEGPDEKVLSVPVRDPRFNHISDLEDVSPHLLKEIENFFATYKTLEGKHTITLGWHGVDVAVRTIAEARQAASNRQAPGRDGENSGIS